MKTQKHKIQFKTLQSLRAADSLTTCNQLPTYIKLP